MPLTTVLTSPTDFTYHLDSAGITAQGTGFTYDADGVVTAGRITGVEFFLRIDLDRDGEIDHIPALIEIDTNFEIPPNDSEIFSLPNTLVLTYVFRFATLSTEIDRGDFWVLNDDFTIARYLDPILSYAAQPGDVAGTMAADAFVFAQGEIRLGTFAGNDHVRLEEAVTSARIALNAGDDVLYAWNSAADVTAFGGVGNDKLSGGDGSDILSGGKGHDALRGGQSGDDRMLGGAGRDFIFGSEGDNVIFGGWGADVITGAGGNDKLTGGAGRDVFWFALHENGTEDAPEIDIVRDFTHGDDRLWFGHGHNGSYTAADAFALFEAHAVQDGADTVLEFRNGVTVFQNTQVADFTLDSFVPDAEYVLQFFKDADLF